MNELRKRVELCPTRIILVLTIKMYNVPTCKYDSDVGRCSHGNTLGLGPGGICGHWNALGLNPGGVCGHDGDARRAEARGAAA